MRAAGQAVNRAHRERRARMGMRRDDLARCAFQTPQTPTTISDTPTMRSL